MSRSASPPLHVLHASLSLLSSPCVFNRYYRVSHVRLRGCLFFFDNKPLSHSPVHSFGFTTFCGNLPFFSPKQAVETCMMPLRQKRTWHS